MARHVHDPHVSRRTAHERFLEVREERLRVRVELEVMRMQHGMREVLRFPLGVEAVCSRLRKER
eukprot:3940548-Rhodomonas_salina.3